MRKIHQDSGADYLLPVKGNHEVLESLAAASLPPPEPSEAKSSATQQPTPPIQPTAEFSPSRPSTALPLPVPPPPCVTAASEDIDNRSRYELRSLRWVAATAETLCCCAARSVVEVTREVTFLRGRTNTRLTWQSAERFWPQRDAKLVGSVLGGFEVLAERIIGKDFQSVLKCGAVDWGEARAPTS